MKLIGYYEGSFNDKVTGKEIKFAKLYVNYVQNGVNGQKCEEIKCNIALVPELKKINFGSDVEVMYDKYGRAQSLSVIGANK